MRLIIVSNRLPVTVTEKNDRLQFERSIGGLASGLPAYISSLPQCSPGNSDHIWFCWPGSTVQENHVQVLSGNKIVEVRNAGINKGDAVRFNIHDCSYAIELLEAFLR